MKQFWRRTNRGLWLGLALLAFLLVFVVVMEVRFRLEKPKIRELTKSYVSDLLNVNAELGDAAGGEPLTEAQKKAQSDALEDVIRKYWYQGEKDLANGYMDAVQLRRRLINWQKSNPNRLVDLQLKFSEDSVSVSADGPNRAKVYLLVDVVTAKVKGYKPVSEEIELFPTDTFAGKETEYGEWAMNAKTIEFQFEVERRGGKWYIVSMTTSLGDSNFFYYNYNFNYGGFTE